jgi:hypothetical protein
MSTGRRGLERLRSIRAPTGMVSASYLRRRTTAQIRLHRMLLAQGHPNVPRVAYWSIQGLAFLRWLRDGTARARAIHSGALPGISRSDSPRAAASLVQLGFKHSVSPTSALSFDLHLPGRADLWADYIYDREAAAFHALRNRALGLGTHAALARQVEELQDKAQTSRRLARLGIPTTHTHLTTKPGEDVDLRAMCGALGPLFCKPRQGARGEGAFIVAEDSSGIRVLKHQASKVELHPVEYSRREFASREYLVQELLVSHPDLAVTPKGVATDVVTVRLITHSPALAGDRVYCAVLEVPHEEATSEGFLFYDLTALDIEHGIPRHRVSSKSASSSEPPIRDRRPIPDWKHLLESGLRAHEEYTSICAIAWDFAITTRGPVLLEGNAGWGVEVPQMINGPLLGATQPSQQLQPDTALFSHSRPPLSWAEPSN